MPFPEIKAVEDVPLADKWTHMVMYGGLTFVLWCEYGRAHRSLLLFRLLLWGVVAPALLGGALELVQEYCTATRSGEWMDFVADAVGVLLGAGLGLMVIRFYLKR